MISTVDLTSLLGNEPRKAEGDLLNGRCCPCAIVKFDSKDILEPVCTQSVQDVLISKKSKDLPPRQTKSKKIVVMTVLILDTFVSVIKVSLFFKKDL